jgi:transposase
MYRDGGIEAVRGRTAPGRKRRLSPEQEARLVQRVKAGATPRDGVASLRGPQIQGILDREFGKTFSLAGIYKLLKRNGFVCLEPRPRHPRQDPAAAKAFKRRAPLL